MFPIFRRWGPTGCPHVLGCHTLGLRWGTRSLHTVVGFTGDPRQTRSVTQYRVPPRRVSVCVRDGWSSGIRFPFYMLVCLWPVYQTTRGITPSSPWQSHEPSSRIERHGTLNPFRGVYFISGWTRTFSLPNPLPRLLSPLSQQHRSFLSVPPSSSQPPSNRGKSRPTEWRQLSYLPS